MEPEIKYFQRTEFFSTRFLPVSYKALDTCDICRGGTVQSTRSCPVSIRKLEPEIRYWKRSKFVYIRFLPDSYKALDTSVQSTRSYSVSIRKLETEI